MPRQYPRSFLILAALAVTCCTGRWSPFQRPWWHCCRWTGPATWAAALQFFIYDAPKLLLLLTVVVFLMGMLNSYFTPERTRALLAGRREGVANVMASGLGVVTPFCSCSAVPLFVGFVQAGVPLGVTFSFLIAAPMVNEVALAMLLGMFGWRVACSTSVLGLTIAIVAGWVLGRLKMERHLEDWVRRHPRCAASQGQVDQ